MNFNFSQHNFIPEQKLTAQELNELEHFVLDFFIKTHTTKLVSEATIASDDIGYCFSNSDDMASLITLCYKELIGIYFDGTAYLCKCFYNEDLGGFACLGNIKAYLDLLVSEGANEEELSVIKNQFNITQEELNKTSTLPFILVKTGDDILCFCVDKNCKLIASFGSHTICPIFYKDNSYLNMDGVPVENDEFTLSTSLYLAFNFNYHQPPILAYVDGRFGIVYFTDLPTEPYFTSGGLIFTPFNEQTTYYFALTDNPYKVIYKGKKE